MNKKEFEEKFPVSLFQTGLNYPQANRLKQIIWQWIEQYAKEARIDENKRLIKIIRECGTWSQTSMGFTSLLTSCSGIFIF